MVKGKLVEPIKEYPDSTKSYEFVNFIKLIHAFDKAPLVRTIDNPVQKRFAKIVIELEQIRDIEVKTKIAKKKQYKQLKNLSSIMKKWRNLNAHDQNWVLNAALINSKQYKARKHVTLKLTDVILHLLYAKREKPIHGRIAMTKQIFLAIKEVFGEEIVENPKFVPYRYGPYSFLLTHILSNLKYDDLVGVKGRKNTSSEKFFLTEKGEKIAKKKFAKLSKELQNELIDRRKGWDQNHIKGILAYVYNKYPEFTEKSMIKKRYKSITWGRAKG